MPTQLLGFIIDKLDTFEIMRDHIAQILKDELQNQVNLADADALADSENYKMKVYTERANPWEQYLEDKPCTTPIVNIWFDSEIFDKKGSNINERQKTVAHYNIDCYGYGKSANIPSGGHRRGDKQAAYESHRAVRLVRNILMSNINTQLQARGVVWERWIDNITSFQPQQDDRAIQHVLATRIKLAVTFNEFSPQSTHDVLEIVSVEIKRASDGEVLAQLEYN